MIAYVSFIHPIQVGGNLNAIEKWQADREGKEYTLSEKGPWFVLTPIGGGDPLRTPLSNVKFVRDTAEPAKVTK